MRQKYFENSELVAFEMQLYLAASAHVKPNFTGPAAHDNSEEQCFELTGTLTREKHQVVEVGYMQRLQNGSSKNVNIQIVSIICSYIFSSSFTRPKSFSCA